MSRTCLIQLKIIISDSVKRYKSTWSTKSFIK